ncbi:MAG: DNA polymerase domain-containing protein [Promethearchaeota archaeon]|nr:MAG: DNA polymerase B [Helarchaeota virus Nidhogg Meg22_1012]URC17326.1 MAG: DNA polymerase B [Helarchaeota virus Nidhogg Meg22_1214]
MRLASTVTEYEIFDGKPVVHLFCRDESDRNKRVHLRVDGYRPYFFFDSLSNVEIPNDRVLFYDITTELKSLDGRPLTRAVVKVPSDVPIVKDKFVNVYETDIPFRNRFKLDKGIKSGVEIPDDSSNVINENSIKPCMINDYHSYIRVGCLDIEVDVRDVENFGHDDGAPITCVTFYDNFTDSMYSFLWKPEFTGTSGERTYKSKIIDGKKYKWYVKTYRREESMLKDVIEHVVEMDYDIFTGWNVESYDLAKIMCRCKDLKIDYKRMSPLHKAGVYEKQKLNYSRGKNAKNVVECYIKGRVIVDGLMAYRKITPNKERSYKLDLIGKKVLDVGKTEDSGNLGTLWEDDPLRLLNYNVHDVEMTWLICEKRSIFEYFSSIVSQVGCEFKQCMSNATVMSIVIFEKAREMGYVIPPRNNDIEMIKRIKGATVLSPKKGIYRAIVLDLKSLYPMIMLSSNISYETYVNKRDLDAIMLVHHLYPARDMGLIRAPNDTYWLRDRESITRKVLWEFISKRSEFKNRRNSELFGGKEWKTWNSIQTVYKFLTNSYYGILGYPGFRLYSPVSGETVTAWGRYIIEQTARHVNEMGYKVIYGDTDSIFIEVPMDITKDDAIKIAKDMARSLNVFYDELLASHGVTENHVEIKFESLYERLLLFPVKKRYAYRKTWDEGKDVDVVGYKGIEVVRSDTSRYTSYMQKKIFKMILEENAGIKEIMGFIRKCREKMMRGRIDYKLVGIPMQITKRLDDYSTNPIHVRAAKWSNKNLGLNLGLNDKPMYAYFKRPYDAIAFEMDTKLPPDYVIDWTKMVEKVIDNKVDKIIDVLGYDYYRMINGQKLLGEFIASS